VAIVIDATPGDIIITCDSDMLAYESIYTLWQPVSNDMTTPELLLALGITRTQFTALAVVSRNDYNRNIRTLGPTSNFSIVRSINSLSNDGI
jgi:hypothetical protein